MAAIASALAAAESVVAFNSSSRRKHVFALRNRLWKRVKNGSGYDCWIKRNLRWSRSVFTKVVDLITDKWCQMHDPLHHNTTFSIVDRVAITLHYLTHADGFDQTAQVFSTSKTRAFVYTGQVIAIINKFYLKDFVSLPETVQAWENIADGFEAFAGLPNVYGAIDGCLVPIKRFNDCEGWYCRKEFPAFNLQAAVDGNCRFMSFSLRSGSQNDKFLFNNSTFGKVAHQRIPVGGCFVADAGYKLYSHVITPCPIHEGMSEDEAHFKWIHSRTRNVVERSFGLWKNTFRIFKTPLLQATPIQMANIVKATLALHNMFIDLDEDASSSVAMPRLQQWMHIGGDNSDDSEQSPVDGDEAVAARNRLKEFADNYIDRV
ncbi:hypothetical protein AeMF1_004435 [Aphanomyces euteiches]|nr:hypothetical protein AeMF1_004435 [Aphanomyces euteiches]